MYFQIYDFGEKNSDTFQVIDSVFQIKAFKPALMQKLAETGWNLNQKGKDNHISSHKFVHMV